MGKWRKVKKLGLKKLGMFFALFVGNCEVILKLL